jgi:lysine biosynthesis protein LysW
MSLSGTCPVCEASIPVAAGVEESEILTCLECQTILVVDAVEDQDVILTEAPRIEEDWGE